VRNQALSSLVAEAAAAKRGARRAVVVGVVGWRPGQPIVPKQKPPTAVEGFNSQLGCSAKDLNDQDHLTTS